MNLSTLPVLLAVIALACAAPDGYGKKAKSKAPVRTTTVASDEPLEFDCSDKEDRGYVIGCNQDYFMCWQGAMTKASCPDGMMFNQDNGQCDFNENIFECSGVRTSTPLSEEHSTLKPIDFDCSKLTDGDYAMSSNDCQAMYVSCVGGQGIERTCPDELQFDPLNRLCERIENIEACGGSATTVASEMEIEFDCPSPDGSFGLTSQLCSAVYYLCKDNKASVAVCDDQMIWDDKNKACALAKDIPDCSFDCLNKADAAYSDGCSQYYWWCWQERAIKQACPEGMKFDGEHGLCDFENNVFECTGVHTTTVAADEPSTMQPVDFDCTGLEDGNHAFKNGEKCQPKFVSCVGGLAWEMTCPDGLLFDPDQLLCERIEAIVACGGTAEPITSTLKDYSYQSTTQMPVTRHHKKHHKTTTLAADVPKDSYGGYNSYETTTIADVPMTTQKKHLKRKHHKTTPLMTTTIAADVPEDNYGGYETTTLAEPITTTRRSYNHRTTTLADIPTTKAYGGYNVRKTTTLADIPTTKAYHHRKTTTLADIPTTKAYGHKRRTTTLADEPITTTLGYNGDDYGEKIDLASTTLSDELLTTPRRRMHHKTTTVAADLPKEDNYYGFFETTTLADIPTTKAYGHKRRTTTLADIPTTKAYGGYNVRKTTTLADIPTTKAYGGYNVRKTTTLADIPTTKSYGYNVRKTTTLADIPTTKAYGGYNQRKLTTTLADIPTTKSYGHKKHHKMTTTTVAADVPEDNYGGYETTTLAEPITTTRRSYNHRRTTTLADIPTTKSYGYNVRKTTTLADIPTTKAYGGYNVRKTTTLADIPTTTRKSYGGYRTTTPLADVPETTIRQRSTYTKVKPTLADLPKQGY